MTRRASKRMTWARFLRGVAATLVMSFSLHAAAQTRAAPGRAAPAADAGAPAMGATAGGGSGAAPDGGVSAAASARGDAGAGNATTPDGAKASASSPMAVPTFRPHAAPLSAPSPEQVAAYEAMRQESEAYEKGARDYKDAITSIITLHYEEKKRAILGGLDREIGIEKDELKKARETAIKRLEEFVGKYSGANAQPEATPDAMYRLAALYEERGRSDEDPNSDLAVTLKPAIALYKRVIREFPKYKELAGIYYFLGHALNDARRSDEAQQVWRSLVCHNHYKYPVASDAKDPDVDKITPMPQDHDEAYWKIWRSKYARPELLTKGPKDETTFGDPYPQDCTIIAQPDVLPGQEPKYVAEAWWRIGDWEFDQLDLGRRCRGVRTVRRVGLQPGRERLHAIDAVQEAAAVRCGSVQVRLDALQAAALRGGGARVRASAQLHRRAAEAHG